MPIKAAMLQTSCEGPHPKQMACYDNVTPQEGYEACFLPKIEAEGKLKNK